MHSYGCIHSCLKVGVEWAEACLGDVRGKYKVPTKGPDVTTDKNGLSEWECCKLLNPHGCLQCVNSLQEEVPASNKGACKGVNANLPLPNYLN
jgi:hypothetical protein